MWARNYKLGYLFGIFYVLSTLVAIVYYRMSSDWIYAYLIAIFINVFGVSFGLHRSVAHQLVSPTHVLVRFATLLGVWANVGSPIDFLISHNLHHSYSDSDQDPQNVKKWGWKLLFGFQDSAIETNLDVLVKLRPALSDKYFRFIHKYYYILLAIFFIVPFAFFGVRGFLFYGVIPSGFAFFSNGLLNWVGHCGASSMGGQEQAQPQNSIWLFPLLLGESWHGTHHLYPKKTSYNQIKHFWELDPNALFFLFIGKKK